MAITFDARNSTRGSLSGGPFGVELGLSSDDATSPLFVGFADATVDEAGTSLSQVDLVSVGAAGPQRLSLFGSFAAYPGTPDARDAWRADVNDTPIVSARITGPANAVFDVTFDPAHAATIFATPIADMLSGSDEILGTNWRDFLGGRGGSDTIRGGKGSDVIEGGAGRDHLAGQGGHDRLTGGAGADALFGGGGRDQLFLDDGDVGAGGGGNDRAFAPLDRGTNVEFRGDGGRDRATFDVTPLIEAATGRTGPALVANPVFDGGPGLDTASFAIGALSAPPDVTLTARNKKVVLSGKDDDGAVFRVPLALTRVEAVEVTSTFDDNGPAPFTFRYKGKQPVQVTTDDTGNLGATFGAGLEFSFLPTGTATGGADPLHEVGLHTAGGDDDLRIDAEANLLMARLGLDISMGGGNDSLVIRATTTDDPVDTVIDAGRGDDQVRTGRGGQTIVDGFGSDRIIGGSDSDIYAFTDDDTLDRLIGWDLEDFLAFEGLTRANFPTLTGEDQGNRLFLLRFQGDELLMRVNEAGTSLSDILDPARFLFDQF